MILYNVTVNIEEEVESDWLAWMKDIHIPEVLATGLFTGNRIFRLLSPLEESPGSTYSIQYFADSLKDLDDYLEYHAPGLIEKHIQKYRNRFVAFRTVLESID